MNLHNNEAGRKVTDGDLHGVCSHCCVSGGSGGLGKGCAPVGSRHGTAPWGSGDGPTLGALRCQGLGAGNVVCSQGLGSGIRVGPFQLRVL